MREVPAPKRARAKQTSPAPKPLRLEDFRYHDQLGIALPQLALCIEVDPRSLSEDGDARPYQFKPGRTWNKLAHQTAGHACHQRYLLASLLVPLNVKVAQGVTTLSHRYYGSQLGCFGVSLDNLIDYRKDLLLLGDRADCNVSHGDLEEGYLPVDIDFLPYLAADTLPKDLDELIGWGSGFERFAGSVGRWRLAILHGNSD